MAYFSCCFAEDGTELFQNACRTSSTLIFLHSTNQNLLISRIKETTAFINKFFHKKTLKTSGSLRDSGYLQNQQVYTWAACPRRKKTTWSIVFHIKHCRNGREWENHAKHGWGATWKFKIWGSPMGEGGGSLFPSKIACVPISPQVFLTSSLLNIITSLPPSPPATHLFFPLQGKFTGLVVPVFPKIASCSPVPYNNRPFPSSLQPLFQSEAKCEVLVMKISFHSYWN